MENAGNASRIVNHAISYRGRHMALGEFARGTHEGISRALNRTRQRSQLASLNREYTQADDCYCDKLDIDKGQICAIRPLRNESAISRESETRHYTTPLY